MYSDYGALGALGVDRQLLAHLHHRQRMRLQTASMTGDWLGLLPTSKSHLVAGDWHSSMRDLQKWRPAPVVMETARRQPLNLDESASWGRRRRDSRDDGQQQGLTDRATDEPSAATTKRRRFDFAHLAESATRPDDASPGGSDRTPSNGGGVKVVKHGDGDQSGRRLSPLSAVESNVDRPPSLMWSLPRRTTASPQPLKSAANTTESLDRYIASAAFDDKIT